MACMAVGPHCFPGDSYAIHVQTKSLGGTGCLGKGVAEGEAEGAPPHFFSSHCLHETCAFHIERLMT